MRDNSTGMTVAAVALCVAFAAVATPALGGPVAFRGWRLDGTGLFVRGESGVIEPADWVVSAARAEDEAAPASGYEDQVAGLDRMGDFETQDASEWQCSPEPREWDERTADDEARRGWWDESQEAARADDRYHPYADGGEM